MVCRMLERIRWSQLKDKNFSNTLTHRKDNSKATQYNVANVLIRNIKPIRLRLERSTQGDWEMPIVPLIKLKKENDKWKIDKGLDHIWTREDILNIHKTIEQIRKHSLYKWATERNIKIT